MVEVVHRWPRVGTITLIGTVLVLASCSTGPHSASHSTVVPWHLSRSPKLSLQFSAGCPASLVHYEDVVDTFPGPPLVSRAAPVNGLVCWYNGSNLPDPGSLGRQVRLSAQEAGVLATALRELNLRPPTGTFNCPASLGTVALIGFSYASRPDVALWYAASGCQTLDNGRLGSFGGANPSFGGFEGAMDKLSPRIPEPSGSV
jgi:hypothetical protein